MAGDMLTQTRQLMRRALATVEQEVIGETKEGPKKAKWWNKRLETRLDYLDKKVKTMAFIFQSFEIRGRLGVVFSLALNTRTCLLLFNVDADGRC